MLSLSRGFSGPPMTSIKRDIKEKSHSDAQRHVILTYVPVPAASQYTCTCTCTCLLAQMTHGCDNYAKTANNHVDMVIHRIVTI